MLGFTRLSDLFNNAPGEFIGASMRMASTINATGYVRRDLVVRLRDVRLVRPIEEHSGPVWLGAHRDRVTARVVMDLDDWQVTGDVHLVDRIPWLDFARLSATACLREQCQRPLRRRGRAARMRVHAGQWGAHQRAVRGGLAHAFVPSRARHHRCRSPDVCRRIHDFAGQPDSGCARPGCDRPHARAAAGQPGQRFAGCRRGGQPYGRWSPEHRFGVFVAGCPTGRPPRRPGEPAIAGGWSADDGRRRQRSDRPAPGHSDRSACFSTSRVRTLSCSRILSWGAPTSPTPSGRRRESAQAAAVGRADRASAPRPATVNEPQPGCNATGAPTLVQPNPTGPPVLPRPAGRVVVQRRLPARRRRRCLVVGQSIAGRSDGPAGRWHQSAGAAVRWLSVPGSAGRHLGQRGGHVRDASVRPLAPQRIA